MTDTFSMLTKDAQKVLSNAERLAKKYKQAVVTPNHLLLALLELSASQAENTLRKFKIDLDNLKARVDANIKLDARQEQRVEVAAVYKKAKLSAESAAILEEAAAEARENGLNFVDTRLLVLGMLRRPRSSAGEFLQQYGLRPERFRELANLQDEAPVDAPRFELADLSVKNLPLPISPIFILIVLLTAAAGYLAYAEIGNVRLSVFFFVIGGWIISLSLHEFGHALAAFIGGDKTVAGKGYLTLNPLKYTHPVLSIVFPIIFLLLGGIPLPGGAVYINRSFLKNNWWQSFVSAAGPLGTLFSALIFALPFLFYHGSFVVGYNFWAGLALLLFLQIVALFLNLLPIPGLDGFGILEPFLPPEILRLAYSVRQFSLFLLLVLFMFTPFGNELMVRSLRVLMWIDQSVAMLAINGFDIFRFWS